jgi:hypothetical protein
VAEGETYPIRLVNSNDQTTEGVRIVFTDSGDEPQPPGTLTPPLEVTPTGTTVLVTNPDTDDLLDWDADTGTFHAGGQLAASTAAAAANVPALRQLTSALTIASGTLPDTGAWVSGTAKVNPTSAPAARQITVNVETVTDGTANAATNTIAISPNGTDFTTIGVPGADAAVNTVGAVTILTAVTLPAGWSIKCTFSHCTVGPSIYY